MKSAYRNAALLAMLAGASCLMADPAVAFDLNGAWVSDADNCAKVFARKARR